MWIARYASRQLVAEPYVDDVAVNHPVYKTSHIVYITCLIQYMHIRLTLICI